MNLDTVTETDIADAAAMDSLADACAAIETAAGLPAGSMIAQHMLGLQIDWYAFKLPADRIESISHWLTVERLWPAVKIGKKTPPTTADRRRHDSLSWCGFLRQ